MTPLPATVQTSAQPKNPAPTPSVAVYSNEKLSSARTVDALMKAAFDVPRDPRSAAHKAAMTTTHTATSGKLGPLKPFSAAEDARHEELMRAHGAHLIERQRLSGIRARRSSTGCYSLYDAGGHHIGRTSAPDAYTGVDATALKAAAWRMALSEEMLTICRQLVADAEFTGAVSSATVDLARTLLAKMEAL